MPGTLYVVATPIGNLEDITLRALRILSEVDLIAAEDTRRTAKLLARHNIQRPMVSLHAHNEGREAPKLVDRIAAGASVALVSDAGTPGISDPGELLVRLAREEGLPVSPIPGPSAITAALSVSGFSASEFVFLGFPPRGGSTRDAWLDNLSKEPRTTVLFEAPHRVRQTIEALALYVKRPIYIYRELTKIHEELVKQPSNTPIGEIRGQGEFVIVIAPAFETSRLGEDPDSVETGLRMIGSLTINGDFSIDEASQLAGRAVNANPKALRKAFKLRRIAAKRAGQPVS